MEPYKRIDSPFHTRRRSKTFGLGKTTLGVREHVQAVGLNAETKNYRQRAEGEIFLLTLPLIGPYRFLVHDRDSIYSSEFDSALNAMGLSILKTPFRAPQENAFCERLVGSMRRECLDF